MKLRTKITVWYTIVLLAVLGTFGLLIYISMSNALHRNAGLLTKIHGIRAASFIDYRNGHLEIEKLRTRDIPGTQIEIYDTENRFLAGHIIRPTTGELTPGFRGYQETSVGGISWLVYDQRIYHDNKMVAWMRATRSLELEEGTLRNLALIILLSVPVCVLVATLGGLFLARRALAPIDDITQTAGAIGSGDLSQRLNMPKSEDEVGRLALVFDEMLDRLEGFVARERRFTSDASHELRTPVTVISAEAQEALVGNKSAEELRKALRSISKAGRRMGLLISQLLELTRRDEKTAKLEIEHIDLKVIAAEVLAEMAGAAEEKYVRLELNAPKSVEMMGDQAFITSLMVNLIDNGINYCRRGGSVKVSIYEEDSLVKVVVEDDGVGIAPEHLPLIFDRFYRADKARNDTGTGLGLSIVRWIVKAHQGSIRVESEPGRGTEVAVDLPRHTSPNREGT